MRGLRLILFCIAAIMSAKSSFAWGCQGHETIALIAKDRLSASAASHVNSLLRTYQSPFRITCTATKTGWMATYSTWADDARTKPAYKETGDWHFWDVPLGVDSATADQYCDDGECIVAALKKELDILKDPQSQKSDRQEALIFIIHLVGDAHQPLHIIDNGDRGGNCLPTEFKADGHDLISKEKITNGEHTGSYTPNLHGIWDANIIAGMTGYSSGANDTKLKAFVKSIETEYADQMDGFAASPENFLGWALETHSLGQKNGFKPLEAPVTVVDNPQKLKNCLGVSSKLVKLNEVVDGDYVKQAEPVIREQLARGGARLASLLNSVWP